MEKLFGAKDTLSQMLEAILLVCKLKENLLMEIGLLMGKKFGQVLLSTHK
jgi:hypothetical protein